MRFKIIETFRINSPQGEIELRAGETVSLPDQKALPLIQSGKLEGMQAAQKIYSNKLCDYLLIADSEAHISPLRASGIAEAIYTRQEIAKLKGAEIEDLRAIHAAKIVFPFSMIEERLGFVEALKALQN